MKKLLLLFLFFAPFYGFSQLIVSDPVLEKIAVAEATARKATTANTIKQLGEAYKQTAELSKTTQFLKNSYDALNTVNTFISNLDRLDRMVTKQKSLINQTTEIVKEMELSKLYTMEEINDLHRCFTKMISTTTDIVEMLDLILKPKTKMSDGERMMLLRQIEDDFTERQGLMDKTLYEYRQLRNQRLVNDTFKKMHIKLK